MVRRRREINFPPPISGAICVERETFTSRALNAPCEIWPYLIYSTQSFVVKYVNVFHPLVLVWKSRKGTAFMKFAALALVLVVASAVVLIFANTLNSWVVGGLIGGLAALLISIPISLIIFSTFARRHDERLYAQMVLQQEEDLAYAEEEDQQAYEEGDGYAEEDEYGRVYEADAYYVAEEEEEFELPRGRGQPEVRSLPPAGQSYASLSGRSTAKQRAADQTPNVTSSPASRRPTRELAYDRERGERAREFSPSRQNQKQQTGHQRTARTPYTTQSLRSQQQAAARRAAQQEAAHGRNPSGPEQLSTGPMQRPTTPRHLPPQSIPLNRARLQEENSRRNVGEDGWLRPTDNRGAKRPSNGGGARPQETQTDQLRDRNLYPSTGPVRMNPETGQMARTRQVDEQASEEEATTGNLYSPLVRRPPYLYEDDPLREELFQHIEKPIKRRASRHLSLDDQ